MIDTEPDDWTTRQSALLDTVRDVALCPDAPGATFAARHLVRLLCLELGQPEPVEREGGIAGVLFGNPPKPAPREAETHHRDNLPPAALDAYAAGEPIRVGRPIRDQPQA